MSLYKEIFPNIFHIMTKGSSCFLVRGKRDVLVDTGTIGTEHMLLEALKALGALDRLSLVFVTHAHSDHCANIKAVCKQTGAKVAVFSDDAGKLAAGDNAAIKPINNFAKLLSKLVKDRLVPWNYKADVCLTDFFDLSEFGIDAVAIALPGHTPGSGGLLVGDVLICGDHVMNFIGKRPKKPLFMNDLPQWRQSTKKVIEISKKFVIAHGGPVFDSADLQPLLG